VSIRFESMDKERKMNTGTMCNNPSSLHLLKPKLLNQMLNSIKRTARFKRADLLVVLAFEE